MSMLVLTQNMKLKAIKMILMHVTAGVVLRVDPIRLGPILLVVFCRGKHLLYANQPGLWTLLQG